jgi:hypothetical protein
MPSLKIAIGNHHPRCRINCKLRWLQICAIIETNKVMAFKEGKNNNFPNRIVVTGEFEGDVMRDVVQGVMRSSRRHWDGDGVGGGGG